MKPEFFRSRSLAGVSIPARLTFIGLWCEADDAGNGIADARILAGSLWPLDDKIGWRTVDSHLAELVSSEHIALYEVDGQRFYRINRWDKHQSAAYRRGAPQYPASPSTPVCTDTQAEPCKEMQAAPVSVLEHGTWSMEGNVESISSSHGSNRRPPDGDEEIDIGKVLEAFAALQSKRTNVRNIPNWRHTVIENARAEHSERIRAWLAEFDVSPSRMAAALLDGVPPDWAHHRRPA